MVKNDALFELIKSLEKSEKRYFKLFASRNQSKGNKYVKLFDALEKQKAYNEKEFLLQKRIGKEVSDNFRFNKHYLYNLILKCLNAYHSEISTEAKLKNMITSIEVLYEKGLFNQCKKIIKKGIEVSEKYESHVLLLAFFKWEMEILRAESYQNVELKEVKQIYKQVFKTIEQHKIINEYAQLTAISGIASQKKGRVRENKELKDRKKLIRSELLSHRLLQKDDLTLPYAAKVHFYTLYYHQLERVNDFKKAKFYMERQVELIESNSHLIFENPIQYISALNNLIICCKHLYEDDKIFSLISKFKNITQDYNVKSERIKNTIFYRACNLELDEYIRLGEFKLGIHLIKKIESILKKSYIKIINKEREIILYYNIAYICFGAEQHATANKYLNKIINDEKTDLRADIYSFARILQLITQYELGNDLLLESMVKSVYRFLYKKNRLYKFETTILNFIKTKSPYMTTPKETINAFVELKNELKILAKDKFEVNALYYFDFIAWLECKIEKEKFETIVRRNYLQR